MNSRDKREHSQFIKWRKGKGSARVAVNRTPTRILHTEAPTEHIDPETGWVVKVQGGATERVKGACIVIMPVPLDKAKRKALLHFCQKREIALVPCEENREVPPGIRPEQLGMLTLTTAFQAFGKPAALKELIGHSYVGRERWYFNTTAKGSRDLTKLARKPAVKVKAVPLSKWTQNHNALIEAVKLGDATGIAKFSVKVATGKGKPE